jgi:predicted protein tyrosine phosphatase
MLEEYALILVDDVLVEWADEIVCMSIDQKLNLLGMTTKPVICLDITDNYEYRNEELMDLIAKQYVEMTKISN